MIDQGKTFRLGSRQSPLARWQANWVAQQLENAQLKTSQHYILSHGDRHTEVPIAEIGSQAVFTKALEEQLEAREIDLAVHSAKDLASKLPQGLKILAFTQRVLPHDVLISRKCEQLSFEKGIRIGTSSPRRAAQWTHYFPRTQIIPIRGNVERRIERLEEGKCDAIVLAYAAVLRGGHTSWVLQSLHPDYFVPAAGQGSLAIEIREDMPQVDQQRLAQLLNHLDTAQALRAERAFLATLGAGCYTPAFGLAHIKGDQIHLHAGRYYKGHRLELIQAGDRSKPEQLGIDVANYVREEMNKV